MNDLKKENIEKINKIKRLYKIFNFNPEFLSTYIILYKSLGMNKQLATDAMEVLYYRVNILNEKFDYNSYISEKIKTIPVIPQINKKIIQNKSFLGEMISYSLESIGKK